MHARSVIVSVCLVWSVAVVGCGDDDSAAPSRIGEACGTAEECGPEEMCLEDQPGGLCVQECTMPGERCGEGALCDTVNVTLGDGGVVDMVLCLQECEGDEDCRTGYGCNGVSSGSGKVCRTE